MTLSNSRALGFAFGLKNHQTTKWLKNEVQAFARLHNIEIDTQPDIDIEPAFKSWAIPEEPNKPSPTLRMARAFIARAKKDKIRRLWVFATKPHKWRVMRDLHMANKEAGQPVLDIKIPQRIDDARREWFDPTSDQIHTRDGFNWYKRDLILRLMPFWLYKRIAS